MDFLSIFLEDFRGPRKTVFCLQITRSKSAGNHGSLRAKSTNFQSRFHSLNGQITSLALKMERENIKRCFGGLRMEGQPEKSPQK